MDPIILVLRGDKSPAFPDPDGAISPEENDANLEALKTGAEQAYAESVHLEDVAEVEEGPGTLADADRFFVKNAAFDPEEPVGEGNRPYFEIEWLDILAAVLGEIPDGPGTAAEIRDALETLTGADRLDATALSGLGDAVVAELEARTGADRLDYEALKNTPTFVAGDPVTVTHDGAGEDPAVGDTLTATPSGGWTGAYQWRRAGTPIGGATSATYLLDAADEGEVVDLVFGDTAGLHFISPGFTVAAGGGGGGGALSSVQSPDPSWVSGVSQFQQTVTAITVGNGAGVTVNSPTAAGAPALSDSAGGDDDDWGAPLHTYNDANGWTSRFYARANITSGLTWVRAAFAGNTDGFIAVEEVAGAGSAISLDDSGGAAQGTSTDWDFPVTSTVDGTLFMGAANLTNGSPPTGVSPIDATSLAGDYAFYARGILATAGAQTGEVNLVDGRNGGKAWAVLRAGA
jgi:hypothetical protein